MSDQQLLIAVVVGILVLVIAIKFWQIILALGVLGAIAVGFLCVQGEIDCPIGIGSGTLPFIGNRLVVYNHQRQCDLATSVTLQAGGKTWNYLGGKNTQVEFSPNSERCTMMWSFEGIPNRETYSLEVRSSRNGNTNSLLYRNTLEQGGWVYTMADL